MSNSLPLRHDSSPSSAGDARSGLTELLALADTAESMAKWVRRVPGLVDYSSAIPGVTIVMAPDPIPPHKAEEMGWIARPEAAAGVCGLQLASERLAATVEKLGGAHAEVQYAFCQLSAAAETIWELWYGDKVSAIYPASERWAHRRTPERLIAAAEQAAMDLRAAVRDELRRVPDELRNAGTDGAAALSPQRRRPRRGGKRKPRPLTPRQTEVMQLVGEHKGNIAAAAAALGVTRQSMQKQYDAALAKLAITEVKHRTTYLPQDQRGQYSVDRDARRG